MMIRKKNSRYFFSFWYVSIINDRFSNWKKTLRKFGLSVGLSKEKFSLGLRTDQKTKLSLSLWLPCQETVKKNDFFSLKQKHAVAIDWLIFFHFFHKQQPILANGQFFLCQISLMFKQKQNNDDDDDWRR